MSARHITLLGTLAFVLVGCGSEEPQPDPQPKTTTSGSGGAKDWSSLQDAKAEEAVMDGRPVLLAGAPGGASYEVARGMVANSVDKQKMALLPTAGSLEALTMIAWGIGDLAIVRGDVLQDPRVRNLAANVEVVAPLYMEEIHVLVHRDAKIKTLADLFGKRIAVGAPGSGAAITAEALLNAGDVLDVTLEHHPLPRALDALADDKVQAVIVIGGSPIAGLLKEGRARLLDLAGSGELDAVLEKLQAQNPNYAAVDVRYDKLGKAKTIGVPAVLVVDKDLKALDELRAIAPWKQAGNHHPKASQSAPSLSPVAPGAPSITFRDAKAPLRLAAGTPGGAYAKVGGGLARMIDNSGGKLTSIETAGSLQNLLLVATGQAELGLVQEDLLVEALASPRTSRLLARVRLVTPLFQEEVHLLRAGSAGIDSLEQLRGKTVGIGAPGSGSLITASRLLRLARIDEDELSARALPASDALAGVRGGKLDAAFFVGSQPLPLLAKGGLPFVSLPEVKGYAAAEIPAETYPGLKAAVSTLSTRAVLICRFDLEDDQVKALVDLVYANRKNLAGLHKKCAELDPAWLDEAPQGLKFHAGVEAAKGDLKPDSADPW